MRRCGSLASSSCLLAPLVLLAACGMTLPEAAKFVYASPDVLTYPEDAAEDATDATDIQDLAQNDTTDAFQDQNDMSLDQSDAALDQSDVAFDQSDAAPDESNVDVPKNDVDAWQIDAVLDESDAEMDATDALDALDAQDALDVLDAPDAADMSDDASAPDADADDAPDVLDPCLTLNCDDSNVCTLDGCNAGSGCTHLPQAGTCSDGNDCTEDDSCQAGTCTAGSPEVCNDGNGCTTDTCVTLGGCVTAANSEACNDGNACTTGDHCVGGTCAAGPPTNCTDSSACTADSCDPPNGCTYTTVPCDDGLACTADSCNNTTGCVHTPGVEICNGLDDDCDSLTDENVQILYFNDGDGDGYGSSAVTLFGCTVPSGHVTNENDCDDNNPNVNPKATESCDGLDNNCNGLTDDGQDLTGCSNFYQDGDKDGVGTFNAQCLCAASGIYTAGTSGDCNDSNKNVFPGATEVCGNGVDDNCNGKQDEAGAQGCTPFYKDADSDGYGSGTAACLCAPSAVYTSAKSGDCNDSDPKMNPDMAEVCNNIDDNCDGTTDNNDALGCKLFFIDADFDGYGQSATSSTCTCVPGTGFAANSGDCDDTKAGVFPGATETCNGVDDNCGGGIDEGFAYGTKALGQTCSGIGACGAGVVICSPVDLVATCSTNPNAFPNGGTEVCDGLDNNCNGQTDEGLLTTYYQDQDGDGFGNISVSKAACTKPAGYVSDKSDCNDYSAKAYPGAAELCNGMDDNCNGATDEGSPCDDGNACTTDSCSGGGCQHASAGAGVTCTGGACDGAGSCRVTPAGMAFIPAGTFWMGCNPTKDSNCNSNESPQHKVTLSAYYMDLTETTVGQYKACVDAGACTVPSSVQPTPYATYPGLTNNPVNFVNWTQSQQYCKWRGAGFDLPTEAQWEMAARGSCEKNGSTAGDAGCAAAMRTYPWGEATATCSYAVMSNGGDGCGTSATWAVGSKTAGVSPYNLHDMAGNVWEWNRDWYDGNYYSISPVADPFNGTSTSDRVLRGGSFGDFASGLRAGIHGHNSPSVLFVNLGLRCSRPFDLCANVTCDANATCGASTGCVCNPGFWGDGTTCTCGGTVTSTTIGGVSRNICAYDYPVWGNRPDSPNTYTVNGDGTVSDSQTQLMWQQVTSGTYTWVAAGTYCDGLTLAGHDDWRLPTTAEGESLYDYSLPAPAINVTVFPGTPAKECWTSVAHVDGATGAWSVDFNAGGSIYPRPKTDLKATRCVRANAGSQPPVTRFIASGGGAGTVLDGVTGLCWQRAVLSNYTWSASAAAGSAQSYCAGLALGNFGSGWRVPNERELFGLVDRSVFNPSIDVTAFPSTPLEEFWTSSSALGLPVAAGLVVFNAGYTGFTSDLSFVRRVRCVHD